MTKKEFLSEIEKGLCGLAQSDIEERVAFLCEMIDDRMEEGLSQEDAVAEMGSVNDVISQIIAETPLPKIVRERVRPKRRVSAWEIVLLAVGSPLWLALLIAALAVILSIYVVIWSVVISLWAIWVSLAAAAAGGVVCAAVLTFRGNVPAGLCVLGAGMICGGVAVLLFFGCKAVTKGVIWLSKKAVQGIKTLMLKKGK